MTVFFILFFFRIRQLRNHRHRNKQTAKESQITGTLEKVYESTKEENNGYHELGNFNDISNYDKLN